MSVKKLLIQLIRRLGYEIVPTSHVMPRDIEGHLKSLFASLDITCVFDVGANIGQYRELLRGAVGYRGLIVSFEPVKHAVEVLRERSRTDSDWLVYQCALGAEDGVKTINVMRADTLSSFLVPDNSETGLFAKHNVIERKEDVQVRALDSVIAQVRKERDIGRNLFLKIDTQGYDLEVIRGASRSLPEICAVQTELSCQSLYQKMPGYLEVLGVLDQLGFQLSAMFPVNQDTSLRIIESDCVMINRRRVSGENVRLMWTNDL